jgi:hypothetical protein
MRVAAPQDDVSKAFTGAPSRFYDPTKEAMKKVRTLLQTSQACSYS